MALRGRPSMSALDPVAVVVVHGIADQRAGQTVRELARLLCHGGAGEPRYVQGEMHEVLVPVARLEPGIASPAETHEPAGGREGPRPRDGGRGHRAEYMRHSGPLRPTRMIPAPRNW